MRESFLENRRNSFYGAAYRQLMRLEVLALLLVFALLCVLGYLVVKKSTPDYYASTTTGREVKIHPLSDPVLTTDFIQKWAVTAARSALNLSFSNYQEQLRKASGYFTDGAWRQYRNAIDSRGLLRQINDNQLIVSAIATRKASILYRRVIAGRYTWRIQVPLLLGIQTSGSKTYQKWVVTMTVVRVSTLDTPRSILIDNIEVG